MQTKQAELRNVAAGWALNLRSKPVTFDEVDGIAAVDAPAEIEQPFSHSLPALASIDGDIVSGRFEYERLSPESRAIVSEQEARLDEIERKAAIAKGRVLRAIKAAIVAEIGHGNWLAWLAARKPKIPETTARCWMRAADWVDESAIVADMDLGAIYRGARAPKEVKSEIVRQLKAGNCVDLDRVVDLIQLHKNSSPKTASVDQAQKTRFEEFADDNDNEVGAPHFPDDQTRHRAEEAAQEVVITLRAFFADDEIAVLNALWQQAGYIEVKRLLRKRECAGIVRC